MVSVYLAIAVFKKIFLVNDKIRLSRKPARRVPGELKRKGGS